MATRYNFNHGEQNPWLGGFSRPGRFGFEVVPDDASDVEADELQYGTVLRTVLACFFIGVFFYAGSRLYEKLDDFSWPALEVKIEDQAAEPQAQMPKVDNALLAPDLEPEATRRNNSEPAPQRRLFNPDGTMKASFPLPPDSPPEDYYVPGREPTPLVNERNRGTGPGFDPEQEAYDPVEERAQRQASKSASVRRTSQARSIGEYEIFDPERDTAVRSDWEYFDDPRR